MSNLLMRTNNIYNYEQSMKPLGTLVYEDHFVSDKLNAFNLLWLSSKRQALDEDYLKTLKQLLSSKVEKKRDSSVLSYSWEINSTYYESTSMCFEYYMAVITFASRELHKILQNSNAHLLDKQHFNKVVNTYKEAKDCLKKWNTTSLIYPACPYVVSERYVTDCIKFVRGTQLLVYSEKETNKTTKGVALSSAMTYLGDIWVRMPYISTIALNHYLTARLLLYADVNSNTDDNETNSGKKITCMKEVLNISGLIDRSTCYLPSVIFDKLDNIAQNYDKDIRMIESVYYPTELNIVDVNIPSSVDKDRI